MNNAILPYNVPDNLLDDLLCSADPRLETAPDLDLLHLRTLLRPRVSAIVQACRTPAQLPLIARREIRRARAVPKVAKALRTFVCNVRAEMACA